MIEVKRQRSRLYRLSSGQTRIRKAKARKITTPEEKGKAQEAVQQRKRDFVSRSRAARVVLRNARSLQTCGADDDTSDASGSASISSLAPGSLTPGAGASFSSASQDTGTGALRALLESLLQSSGMDLSVLKTSALLTA